MTTEPLETPDDPADTFLSRRLVQEIETARATALEIVSSREAVFVGEKIWEEIIMLVTMCGAATAECSWEGGSRFALVAQACKAMERLRDNRPEAQDENMDAIIQALQKAYR